ncbi:amidohydrolase family protein [Myxococcaceae bacterium GXIMD 01537]
MRDGMHILDADRHVIEPLELWREYLPPALRDGAPYPRLLVPRESLTERVARLGARGLLPLAPTLMLDGEPVARGLSEESQLEAAWLAYQRPGHLEAGASPRGQLHTLDATGVDVAFLYPSLGLWLLAVESLAPERATALMRAYNDWLRDFCREDPQRLRGVGAIARHSPEGMVAEAERVAGWGWRAVTLWPNPLGGRLLSDAAYAPFWSACERLGLAVGIHAGSHGRLPTAGSERFESRFAQHMCSHPLEQMMAVLALIEGGVLERYPGLRVAFLEAGCGWLPYWLWRMDALAWRYAAADVASRVRRPPSETFRRQCFIAVEPDEPGIEEAVRAVGADCLLFGSDFPHLDHDDGIVARAVGLRARLGEEVTRKLLWDNPARFYGLGQMVVNG